MKMLKPLNKHVLIEPIEHEGFIASEKSTYDEVGIVIDSSEDLIMTERRSKEDEILQLSYIFTPGWKVFFDSWEAKKYPKDNEGNFYWVVPFSAISGYEIPKELL